MSLLDNAPNYLLSWVRYLKEIGVIYLPRDNLNYAVDPSVIEASV